jgi:hypothetical protein
VLVRNHPSPSSIEARVMGKTSSKLEPALARVHSEPAALLVGTAPNAATGHVNISPKGASTRSAFAAKPASLI